MSGRSVTCSFLLILEKLTATANGTDSRGSDETTLLSTRSVSLGDRGGTNVLMVTTTMRMLNGVHGDTSNSGPVALLDVGLLVGVGSEEGLVSSLTASDSTDHDSAATLDGLSHIGGESDSGLLTVFGVTDDDGGDTGGTGEHATVT